MATFAVLNQANKQHAYYNGKGTVLVRYKGKKCCLGIEMSINFKKRLVIKAKRFLY